MEIQKFSRPSREPRESDQLRHSNVWEDQACLLRAARSLPTAPKRILSIAGAGDNALSLLELDPAHIVILDQSPSQAALTELKWRALAHLPFHDYLNLLGYTGDAAVREDIYEMIRLILTPQVREYWDTHSPLLFNGLVHQGRLDGDFEKFRLAVVPRIWAADVFKELTETQSLSRQMQCWQSGDMDLLKMAVGDFFKGPIFLKNLERLVSTHLISQNPYLFFFLTGSPLFGENALPLLNEDRFNEMKMKASRAEILCTDLESYLSERGDSFDFMNLSDIFEDLSDDESANLFRALAKRVNPGGAVAYWNVRGDRRPTQDLLINESISHELTAADQTWLYSNFVFAQRPD